MGNKAEITNLIGRKGSKMTMQSNVKTLALKVYDEVFDSRGCRHGIKNDKFLLERKQRLEQNIKEITQESKRQNRLKRITTV